MNYLRKIILVAGVITITPTLVHAKKQFPNIVIFFMDDMGYGDLTITGATGYETPNIDNLAKEGMFFSQFYAAQPISSASRAGLMTGCYPNRVGISGALMPQGNIGLDPNEEILPEVLKTKGYTCGMVGKWHLGHLRPFMPLQQGFDEYFGLPYSNDMWPVDYSGKRVTQSSGLPDKLRHPALPLIDGNDKIKELWTLDDQSHLTSLYTERAVKFIEKNHHTPFFLYFAHSMPHVPLAVSDNFKGKSKQGLYGDVMMEVDWSIQKVLETIKKYHLDENTLIIFTSDNGPWYSFGNHAGSNGGLREAKATTFEGGQRVPCIMRWKGVIPQGSICNQLASTIDILPTIVSIIGAQLPKNKIDGINILPLLKGKNDVSPRKYLLYYFGKNSLEAVRNDRFKLVLPHDYSSYLEPGNDGWPGKREKKHTELELFDLRRDPGERMDVKNLYPEVVNQLIEIVKEARLDLGDDLTGAEGSNRRKVGLINN